MRVYKYLFSFRKVSSVKLLTIAWLLLLPKCSHQTKGKQFTCEDNVTESAASDDAHELCEAQCEKKSEICAEFFVGKSSQATCSMTIFLMVGGKWRSLQCASEYLRMTSSLCQREAYELAVPCLAGGHSCTCILYRANPHK